MGYIGNAPYQGVLTGANIQDGTVDTADIANDAVTTVKMADVSVTAGKLHTTLDLSAKTVTLPDGSVTDAKLASGIDASKLTTGTMPIARIADASITAAKLAAGAAVPVQTGNSGKFLTTDGTNASWGVVNTDLVADTSPQLGGDLDLNSHNITNLTKDGFVIVKQSTSAPAAPVNGQMWWDNATGNVKIYDSSQSSWFLIKSGLDGSSATRAIPSVSQVTSFLGTNFAAGAYYISTQDGGVQRAYLLYAENYVWVLVGRFQADASVTIQNTIPSQRGMVDVSQNGASYWSADWGSALVEDVMVWGATDFATPTGHTVNWVYEVKKNSTLRGFFAGVNSGDDYNDSQDSMPSYVNTKPGLRCYGARDGVFKGSRWTNAGFNHVMISDFGSGHWTNSYGFSNPLSATTYWDGMDDAKLVVSHTNSYSGQDVGFISSGFGWDDNTRHFADFYPSEGGQNNTTANYSSAVTIWARF